ncbi:hypothetical protein HDU67_007352, partial [Dinochytrium kinnereticum]
MGQHPQLGKVATTTTTTFKSGFEAAVEPVKAFQRDGSSKLGGLSTAPPGASAFRPNLGGGGSVGYMTPRPATTSFSNIHGHIGHGASVSRSHQGVSSEVNPFLNPRVGVGGGVGSGGRKPWLQSQQIRPGSPQNATIQPQKQNLETVSLERKRGVGESLQQQA